MTSAYAVLNGAADHIDRYGLRKGREFDGRHPFTSSACAHGALWIAAHCHGEFDRAAYRGAVLELGRHIGCDSIIEWNDAAERTAAEVVRALRTSARTALLEVAA